MAASKISKLTQRAKQFANNVPSNSYHDEQKLGLCCLNPVLQLCRLAGFLPVTTGNQKIGFSWLSFPLLWYLTCFGLCIYLSLLDFTLITYYTVTKSVTTDWANIPEENTTWSDAPTETSDETIGISLNWADLMKFVMPVWLGIIIARILRSCLNVIFLLVFLGGLETAIKAEKYFKKLDDCFNLVCTTFKSRQRIIRNTRSAGFWLLVVFVLLYVTNSINYGVLSSWVKVPQNSHSLIRSGSITFKLWYGCHVLLALLTITLVTALKDLFRELNSCLEELMRPVSVTTNDPTDICKNGTTKKHGKSAERFFQDFGKLRSAFFLLEELLHKRNFLFSSFIAIEIVIALVHLTGAITVFLDPIIELDWIHGFEIFYHSCFALKLVWEAAKMNEEAKTTDTIMSQVSLEHVPLECHSEVAIFVSKVLTTPDPAIRFFGLRLDWSYVDKVKSIFVYSIVGILVFAYVVLVIQVAPKWLGNKPNNNWTLNDSNVEVPGIPIPGVSDLSNLKRSFLDLMKRGTGFLDSEQNEEETPE